MTEFKKYKNRKIYNTATSKYATLSDVYYTALQGPVTVTDVTTGEFITNETVLRGALEIFGSNELMKLVTSALTIGIESGLKAPEEFPEGLAAIELAKEIAQKSTGTFEEKQEVQNMLSLDLGNVKEDVDDLFSGKGAQ